MKTLLVLGLVAALPLAAVADDNNDKYVSANSHSVILDANGKAYAAGENDWGQIGNGKDVSTEHGSSDGSTTFGETFEASFVPVLGGYTWKWIHAAGINTYGIQNDGSLWAWGGNVYHQLGDPGASIYGYQNVPVKISGARWRQIKGRMDTPMAIKTDGTLWSWGDNSDGMCGATLTYEAADNFSEPQQVGNDRWLDAASGYYSSVGVKADGTLWAWGSNRYFNVEPNDSTASYAIPQQVGTDNDWVAVGAGTRCIVAQKKDGSLWTWGNNERNCLGIAGVAVGANIKKPTKVLEDVRTFSVGDFHVLAIKNDGTLWGWGGNIHYNLGTKDSEGNHKNTFEIPQQLSAEQWVAVAAGGANSIAIKADGNVWSAGFNRQGQSGVGEAGDPVQANPDEDYTDMPFAGLPLAVSTGINSIENSKGKANFSIHNGSIQVEGNINKLAVYSVSGALVDEVPVHGDSVSLSTEQLSNGAYIIKAEGDDGFSARFIK